MEKLSSLLLRLLPVTQLSLAGMLGSPRRDDAANSKNDLILSNGIENSVASGSRNAAPNKGGAAAELTGLVSVTIITIEAGIVNTIIASDDLNDSNATALTSEIEVGDRCETANINCTAEPDTSPDGFAEMAPLTANSATTSQPADLPSSLSQIMNADGAMTTFAMVTAVDTSSSPTSTFNDDICDDIYCNTDGSRVCIYWGGVTSWDVSLGPLPGERPTIIGTC